MKPKMKPGKGKSNVGKNIAKGARDEKGNMPGKKPKSSV